MNVMQRSGRPCIQTMRIQVSDLIDLLGQGSSEAEILVSFFSLGRGDFHTALFYTARWIDTGKFPYLVFS
ncbi:DUF433 domain-containing protein (plasmid) [Deinococcus psychrotolerans]|uniref:DUF433 domain-containing protein n=1 Tax=Deinococcus psychrotolerans TaxID=2489213 RepID=A0A3G8YTS6_9DEIO|nr:DUF433 domain-containing protein [Deinococcus psychrotolerans]AZI45101.1 DUF433 domain-containing protein [Deinococcus psychrotolerans]